MGVFGRLLYRNMKGFTGCKVFKNRHEVPSVEEVFLFDITC